MLLTLKIGMGPAGIEPRYPRALLEELAAQTGLSVKDIGAALNELEAGGWIRREGNVLWIVGQLEYEPSLKASNPNHRASVQQHVAGLPRLALVGAFIREYAAFFPDADAILMAYPMPSDSHEDTSGMASPMPSRLQKTEDRVLMASEGHGGALGARPSPKQRKPDEPEPLFDQAWVAYPKRQGGNPKDRARKSWRARLREGTTATEMLEGVRRYATYCDQSGKTDTEFVMQAATFFGPDRRFAEDWGSVGTSNRSTGTSYCSPAEVAEAYG